MLFLKECFDVLYGLSCFLFNFFSLSIPEAHTIHNTKGLKPFKVYNSMGLIKNKVPDGQVFKVLTCVIVYMVFRPFFHYM